MSGSNGWCRGFAAFAVMGIGWGLAFGQASVGAGQSGATGAGAPPAAASSSGGGMRDQSVGTRDPALAAWVMEGSAAGSGTGATGATQGLGAGQGPGTAGMGAGAPVAGQSAGASVAGQAAGAPMGAAGAPAGMAGGQEMSPMGGGAHMGGARKADPSTALTLTIGGRTVTLRVEDLERMPQRTVLVHNAHLNADETYTGVAMGDLLAANGLAATDAAGVGRMLRSYVRATGSDGYFVVYSGVEVESGLHAGEVIVATRMGGRPLGEDGRMKLVSSEDKRPARWVRNLMGILVTTVE